MKIEPRDEELEARLAKYDAWMTEGKIPTSSKVIPVREALCGLQWVLPTQQVLEILRNSRSFALANCLCRTKHKRCDNPLEVCFYINDVADQKVAQGAARHVSLEEAMERFKLANKHGLVHLTIYNPDQHVFAVCSCCECCCHDIEFMKKYNRPDLIAHADYVVEVDRDKCNNCYTCTQRCVFGAQEIGENTVTFYKDRCYGCGLCVTTCPTSAISMKLKKAK
jgi:Pyruvate/2-oxoacid:ferredoxin oxidoreductase delta subunit